MVRGNYQRRIEAADARKLAAKQRKQRRDNRGTYKAMVLELFSSLDRHDFQSTTTSVIHVWIDSAPSDSPPLLDMYSQDHAGKSKKGGGRGKKGGRARSNSVNEEKKKAHPRSKEADSVVEDSLNVPHVCQKHFYTGKCEDLGKKGAGCRHVHLPGRYKTLAQVVNEKQTLSQSEQAILKQDGGSEEKDGGVDMIYYLDIRVDGTAAASDGDDDSPLHASDLVSKKLCDESCGVASIVYVAIDNTLVFDRYREGIIVSENDLHAILHGDERRPRSASVFSEDGDDNAENDVQGHNHIVLPAHVLEYILMFLPDEATSFMSMVCGAWHQEIGQHSPNLWRRLLVRRDWPLPDDNETQGTTVSLRDVYRKYFLRHFAVLRDVEAVKQTVGAITSPSRKVVEEKEMVYEAFSARRLAPQEPNGCVAVRVWSAGQVLAAYSHDCTLRLFKAIAKTADVGSAPRACRELVCVSVDPFRKTKRRRSQLVAMALDDDVIGCLCHVMGDDQEKETYILAMTRRDDFLCAAGNSNQLGGASLEEETLHSIDVGEAVLNFLLSCDEVDHRLMRLFDFLSDGGDVSEVEVLVSQSIQACGYGRFLVEVAISIPSLDMEEEEDDDIMILLDRKVILFSASAGAIIWMGDTCCNPTDELLPRQKDFTMASFSQVHPGDRRATCSLVFVSSASHAILSAELDVHGQLRSPSPIEASSLVRNELLENHWQMHDVHHRPAVITSTDVVVVDSLFRDMEGGKKVNKSVLSFYPRLEPNISYATLTLEGDCEAFRMEGAHDEYVVVLCRVHTASTQADEAINGIDGHWFADDAADDEPAISTTIEAMVVHVPSRREIHRVCLLEEEPASFSSGNYDIPVFFTPNKSGSNTFGVGLWWKGIILTGSAVREVGRDPQAFAEDTTPRSARKQKKKKRQQGKGGKKDGFARGMSLRG